MTDVMPAAPVPTVPEGGRPPSRRGWPIGRLLGWAFGLVVGVGLLGSILLPSLCAPRESANRAKCASNLRQIGLAILHYQQDNTGAYPDTLGRLFLNEQIGAEVFVCPSGNDEKSTAEKFAAVAADIDAGPAGHHCSFLYFGRRLSGNVPATTVVACDAPDDHDRDGVNVLYGDGHVDWQPPAAVVKLLPAGMIPDDVRWKRAAEAVADVTVQGSR